LSAEQDANTLAKLVGNRWDLFTERSRVSQASRDG
jgi:hypothetical protein